MNPGFHRAASLRAWQSLLPMVGLGTSCPAPRDFWRALNRRRRVKERLLREGLRVLKNRRERLKRQAEADAALHAPFGDNNLALVRRQAGRRLAIMEEDICALERETYPMLDRWTFRGLLVEWRHLARGREAPRVQWD